MFPSSIHSYSIIHLKTVDSTNNYAASNANQPNVQHKTVIMASFQSKGKGQLLNKWQSEKDQNLLLSIFLLPKNISTAQQFDLSRITALAIRDTISYFLKSQTSIKWPNDIFVKDKKIAGILIENSVVQSEIDRSIIGIGINVNQSEFDTLDATSLKLESNSDWDLQRILEFLLYRFDHYFDSIDSHRDEIRTSFDMHLYKRKEWLSMNNEKLGTFIGRIMATAENGCLLVEDQNAHQHQFNHKEIAINLTQPPNDQL